MAEDTKAFFALAEEAHNLAWIYEIENELNKGDKS